MNNLTKLHEFKIQLPDGTITTAMAYSVEHALHESGLLNSWYEVEEINGEILIIITQLDEPETC